MLIVRIMIAIHRSNPSIEKTMGIANDAFI